MPAQKSKPTKRSPSKKAAKKASSKKKSSAKKAQKRSSNKAAAKKASPKRAAAKGHPKKPSANKEIRRGPSTEVTPEVLEFINALDEYKKERNRPFPTWSEVLEVIKLLGYRRP